MATSMALHHMRQYNGDKAKWFASVKSICLFHACILIAFMFHFHSDWGWCRKHHACLCGKMNYFMITYCTIGILHVNMNCLMSMWNRILQRTFYIFFPTGAPYQIRYTTAWTVGIKLNYNKVVTRHWPGAWLAYIAAIAGIPVANILNFF